MIRAQGDKSKPPLIEDLEMLEAVTKKEAGDDEEQEGEENQAASVAEGGDVVRELAADRDEGDAEGEDEQGAAADVGLYCWSVALVF